MVYVGIDLGGTNIAVGVVSEAGSILADRKHLGTFTGGAAFYPSPAVSINTLPNVVVGEVATRFRVKGETTFLILSERDGTLMDRIITSTLAATGPVTMVTGWVDCGAPDTFEADLQLITTF